jgi:hypothetical protein
MKGTEASEKPPYPWNLPLHRAFNEIGTGHVILIILISIIDQHLSFNDKTQ